MTTYELIALRETVYDNRCKLLVVHHALPDNLEMSEEDLNGFRAALCDVMHNLETVETRLTPTKSPISATQDIPKTPEISTAEIYEMFPVQPGNGHERRI